MFKNDIEEIVKRLKVLELFYDKLPNVFMVY